MRRAWILATVLLATSVVAAADFTLYELLAPDSHRFAITYDITTAKEGDLFFLNPIREGSIANGGLAFGRAQRSVSCPRDAGFIPASANSDDSRGAELARIRVDDARVVDRASGKPLRWELVKGAIKVDLGEPVPKDGERRIRIFKMYTDPKSYYAEGDRIVFDRGLSIRRNAVVLPAGYELASCSVPAIVSTEADGRVKASFVNDRDDTLPVKIVGRRLPGRMR